MIWSSASALVSSEVSYQLGLQDLQVECLHHYHPLPFRDMTAFVTAVYWYNLHNGAITNQWEDIDLVLTYTYLLSNIGENFRCNMSSQWPSSKESASQCRRHKKRGFNPWVGKSPWSRKWQPDSVLLPGKSHGHRILAVYSPWGRKESAQLSK